MGRCGCSPLPQVLFGYGGFGGIGGGDDGNSGFLCGPDFFRSAAFLFTSQNRKADCRVMKNGVCVLAMVGDLQ